MAIVATSDKGMPKGIFYTLSKELQIGGVGAHQDTTVMRAHMAIELYV